MNLGNTTPGNLKVNTLGTEQYIPAGWGLVGEQLDQLDGSSGKGNPWKTLAASVTMNGNTLTMAAGSATLTLPAATDTLVGRATTDTLTNKTYSGGTLSGNTLSGTFSGSLSGTLGGSPTWTGQHTFDEATAGTPNLLIGNSVDNSGRIQSLSGNSLTLASAAGQDWVVWSIDQNNVALKVAKTTGQTQALFGLSVAHSASNNVLTLQNSADNGKQFQRVVTGTITTSTSVAGSFNGQATVSWPATFGSTPYTVASGSGLGTSWASGTNTVGTTAVTAVLSSASSSATGVVEVWGIG